MKKSPCVIFVEYGDDKDLCFERSTNIEIILNFSLFFLICKTSPVIFFIMEPLEIVHLEVIISKYFL